MPLDINQLLPLLIGQKIRERQLGIQQQSADSLDAYRQALIEQGQQTTDAQTQAAKMQKELQDLVTTASTNAGTPLTLAPGEAGPPVPPGYDILNLQPAEILAKLRANLATGALTPQGFGFATGQTTFPEIEAQGDIAGGTKSTATESGQLDLGNKAFGLKEQQAILDAAAQVGQESLGIDLSGTKTIPDFIAKLTNAPPGNSRAAIAFGFQTLNSLMTQSKLNNDLYLGQLQSAVDQERNRVTLGLGQGQNAIEAFKAQTGRIDSGTKQEEAATNRAAALGKIDYDQLSASISLIREFGGLIDNIAKNTATIQDVDPASVNPLMNSMANALTQVTDFTRAMAGKDPIPLESGGVTNILGREVGGGINLDPRFLGQTGAEDPTVGFFGSAEGTVSLEDALDQEINVGAPTGITPGSVLGRLATRGNVQAPQGGGGSNGNVQPPLPLTNEQLGESPDPGRGQVTPTAATPAPSPFSRFNDVQKMGMAEQAGVPNVLETYNSLVLKSGIETASAWLDTILADISNRAFLDTAPPLGTSESPRSPSPKPSTVRSGGTPSTVRSRR